LKNCLVALIGIVVLPVYSCRTIKENTSIQKADNIQWNKKVSVTLGATPARILHLRIPTDSLRALANGMEVSGEKEGLKVLVGVTGEDFEVRAETVSSPELTYTEEISVSKVEQESKYTEIEKEAAIEPFKRCLNGIAALLTLVLIILIILKWQKRKQDRSD